MKTERDIINYLAEKYKMTDAKILNIIHFQDKFIKEKIKEHTPRILIHNWGSFNLNLVKINKVIKQYIRFKRKGIIPYETAKEKVTELLKIKREWKS